jgi:hypothetical protein
LFLKKETLSSLIRTKISAPSKTQVSKSIGYIGVIMLSMTLGTALVSGKKLEATGKLDTANTNIYIHSRLLSCIGTSISMKTDGVKPVVWIQTVPVGNTVCFGSH